MTGPPRPRSVVVVPLDGSRESRAALPVGRTLARLTGATLHVVHVSPTALAAIDAEQRLAVCGEGDTVVVDTPTGDPAAAILASAHQWEPSFVVMSAHSGHPRASTGLGHVAEAVLRAAERPVVFVPPRRGEAAWEPTAVLLPLDGTPASASAMPHATRIAHASGADLVLLHVAAAGLPPEREAGTIRPPRYADQPQHEWPAWSDEFISRAACHCGDKDQMRLYVAKGAPGPETLRVASEENADLIVIAWHGVLNDTHAATLRSVLTGASCPVMIVRA